MIDSRDDIREIQDTRELDGLQGAARLAASDEMLEAVTAANKGDVKPVEAFREAVGSRGFNRYDVIEVRGEFADKERMMEIPEEDRQMMADFEKNAGNEVVAVAQLDMPDESKEYLALVQGKQGVYTKALGADDYPPVN